MKIYEAIKTRRSVRSYRKDLVPKEKLERMLEAARLAPSASNRQQYKFVVVTDPLIKEELSHVANGQDFIAEAPIIIVAVSLDPDSLMSSTVPSYAVDLGIALDHITLTAVEEGLGTCWIGAFSQKEVKNILNVPEQYKVVALMPLGFPAEEKGLKIRKDIKELVCYESFS